MRAVSPAEIGIVYRTVKNYAMDSRDECHKKKGHIKIMDPFDRSWDRKDKNLLTGSLSSFPSRIFLTLHLAW